LKSRDIFRADRADTITNTIENSGQKKEKPAIGANQARGFSSCSDLSQPSRQAVLKTCAT
jgi:hypothetical protein